MTRNKSEKGTGVRNAEARESQAKKDDRSSVQGGEQAKESRYKESDIIMRFLQSKMGIPFLIRAAKKRSPSSSSSIISQIDSVIDFYTSWTSSFPVRRNLKMSKYEFLKHVEDYCSKSDVAASLDSLFK